MTARGDRSAGARAAHAQDLELVQRARNGNRVAAEALVNRLACLPAMLRGLHRRYGSPLGVEDLLEVEQSTLAALWAKLATYEGRAALETWAFRFAHNELLKALARGDRQRLRVDDGEAVLEQIEAPSTDSGGLDPALVACKLEQLGSPASDVIRSRHFDGRGFDDIAREMGESVSTIKARYYRGLERLREMLEPHWRRI